MDFGAVPILLLSLLIIIFSFRLLVRVTSATKTTTAKQAPEPRGAWPIIGHLHQLGSGDRPCCRTLAAMADQYGPTFSLRLGSLRAFVVSRTEEARECFTVNDKALASRPPMAATELMCYNNTMFGFAPYGSYWQKIRKIVLVELLSNIRLEKLRHVWEAEINVAIKELHAKSMHGSTGVVNLTRWLDHLLLNVIVRIVAGKRYYGDTTSRDDGDRARRFQKAIAQFFHFAGMFVISDVFPSLWWLDLQGQRKAMKETFKEIDSILGEWLEEHRAGRDSGDANTRTDRDFMDAMLSVEEEGQFSNLPYDADTCIKSTCLSMIFGGSESTSSVLVWAISLLVNNPHALKKAQQELDDVVGQDRMVDVSDISQLAYLQSIIKETLRLYPPGPLLAPREAIEDCTVGGYHVRAGTRLIMNVWRIQRDPHVWNDPNEFRPERFLSDHAGMDVRGHNFELIPFGSGRRSCPGTSLAQQVVHLALAHLLHGFEIATPNNEPVDMTERPGLNLPKATPLEVLLTPRLRASLYV